MRIKHQQQASPIPCDSPFQDQAENLTVKMANKSGIKLPLPSFYKPIHNYPYGI
jgi:hypothetical protein